MKEFNYEYFFCGQNCLGQRSCARGRLVEIEEEKIAKKM